MVKIVLTYSVFLVIFTTIITALLTYVFTKDYEKNLISSNRHLLEQVKLNTDKYMLDKLDQLNSLYFSGTPISTTFSEFYTNVYNPSDKSLSVIQDNLQKMVSNNKFILDIYLYNMQADILVTPDGIYRDATNGKRINSDFLGYVSSIKTDFWVSPLNNMQFWGIKDVLTYVHFISTNIEQTVFSRSYYVAIININTQDIIKFMENVPSATGDLMIMSADKKVIAHSNSKSLYAFTDSDNLSGKIASSDSGNLTANVDNRLSVVSWTKSGSNDFRYVSIVPVDILYKSLNSIQVTVFFFSAFISIFGILLLRPITFRMYSPFAELLTGVQFNLDSAKGQAETEAGNIIENIQSHTKEMSEIIAKYNSLILNKNVIDLLRGWLTEPNELLKHFEIAGKKMSAENYSVILIELNKNILNLLPMPQRELTIYRIIDFTDHFFETAGLASISVTVSSNGIASIINHNNSFNMEEFCRGLLENIAKDIKITVNVYISEPTGELGNISPAYAEIYELTKYSYIYGFGNVFTYYALRNIEKNSNEFDIDTLKDIEKCLVTDNAEGFHRLCKDLFYQIKHNGYSYSYAQSALLQLVSLICRVARSRNIPIDVNENMDNTLNSVLQNTSFDQNADNILQLADIYFQRINDKDLYQTTIFLNKILDYINENIDKEISLASVADHFNISSGYLSKFFKEKMNTQFSKYVTDKKFEAAAEMLIKNNDVKISTVANQLGYYDTVYFSRQFKERYGCTPAQYRKINMQ